MFTAQASERQPTDRERAFLRALAAGVQRPAIGGPTARMCRTLGWAEALFLSPDGRLLPRSELDGSDIAVVKAGFLMVGFTLTSKGRAVLDPMTV